MSELPKGWATSTIGEWCVNLDSKRIPINSGERNERLNGKKDHELYPYYGATGQVGRIDGYLFDGEYVLIGEDGAPFMDPYKDKAYMVSGRFWVNNHAHILAPHANPKFTCYYLNQFRYADHVTGTTRLKLTKAALEQMPIVIPPLAEQRRIVGKVEELFSELDEGVANLKQARAQLAVYRQALLKHAFEGHLTADWRSTHASELESADQLLARIRVEREERYEQQIKKWEKAMEKWEADGSTEKKPSKPTKPAFGISKVETDKMLPKGWAKLELEYLAVELVLGKMLDKAKNIGKSRPYLGNINVRWGTFELENLKEMRIEDSEVSRYCVEPGDLVVCEGGEPGRCAIWKATGTDVFIQKALHRVRFTESFDSRFAYLYLTLVASTQQLEEYFTGTTIKHLTGAGLAKIAFPLCSMEEQREIISKLEAQISAIDVVEADIDLNLQKAEALRQSILKKAFAGELVPQDPADEPAAALLARIRAERDEAAMTPKFKKTRIKKA